MQTHVALLYGACNRDPREFEAPTELRLDRPNARKHLGFGRGVHTCAGMPLAKAEVTASLNRILDRMMDIKLSEPIDTIYVYADKNQLIRILNNLVKKAENDFLIFNQ